MKPKLFPVGLCSKNLEVCLRQDQAVLRSVVFIHAGLLGIQLIMKDGQLAQALHKRIGFWGKNCEIQNTRGLGCIFFLALWFILTNSGIKHRRFPISATTHVSLILNPSGECKKLFSKLL